MPSPCWQPPISSVAGQAYFGLPIDSKGIEARLVSTSLTGCHQGSWVLRTLASKLLDNRCC